MSVTTSITRTGVDYDRVYSERSLARAALPTGVQMAYVDQGESSDPAVVLLHGLSDSSWSFARLVPELTGVRTVAIDLRGHGGSSAPADGYRPEDLAGDVVALLDHLGITRATVVGHSLGSVVAREVVHRYPGRVERLVLVGTIATPVNEGAAGLADEIAGFGETVPEAFVRGFQESTLAEPVPSGFMERVISESLRLRARVWRAAVAGMLEADDSDRLAGIDVPTLLMWGDQDAWFPREEQDRMAAAISGARLVVFEGAGHDPHWERPGNVAALLTDFLQEARPRQSSRSS